MTYEEFVRIPKIWRKLMRDVDHVIILRETVTSLPPMRTDGRVQTSNLNRSMALADALIDAERDIQDRTEAMHQLEEEALRFIAGVKEPERNVLFLHYVRHMPITDVALVMYFTPRWCYVLRKRGLAILRERGRENTT